MNKRFDYEIFCDNEGIIRVLRNNKFSNTETGYWKLFYDIDGNEPTLQSPFIFVIDNTNLYTISDINKTTIYINKPTIKFKTGARIYDEESSKYIDVIDDNTYSFKCFENKSYNYEIAEIGANIVQGTSYNNKLYIILKQDDKDCTIGNGTIYITFDDTIPTKNNFQYKLYNHSLSSCDDIELYNCVVKAVVVYGDYTSEIVSFAIGDGDYEMELPIINLKPLSIDFKLKNNERGEYEAIFEDNETYRDWEIAYNVNSKKNAIYATARKRRLCCTYKDVNGNGTQYYYRYTDYVVQKDGIPKPFIKLIPSTDFNNTVFAELYVKNNKEQNYKIKYSINYEEYKDYSDIISLKSNDILQYYNTDGTENSSTEVFEVGNIDFENIKVEYDIGQDIIKSINIPELPSWLNICSDSISLYDENGTHYLGSRNLPSYLNENHWDTIIARRYIGIKTYDSNNSYQTNYYFKRSTTIKSLDLITYTPPSIDWDDKEEQLIITSNGNYEMYLSLDNSNPNELNTPVKNGATLKPTFGTIIKVIGFDSLRQVYTDVTTYTFKKLYKPTIKLENGVIKIYNPNKVGVKQIQINENGSWLTVDEIQQSDDFKIVKCRIIYNEGNNYYESKEDYLTYFEPYVTPPTLIVDKNGNVIISSSDTNTIRYIINGHFVIPTNIGNLYEGQNIKLDNNDYIEAISVNYENNYSNSVSYFYSKDYITSTGVIIEKLNSDKVNKVNRTPYSYFDIISNNDYELPKILTSINYILNSVNSNFDLINKVEENLDRRYSGYKCKIYNEENDTGILDISTHDVKNYNSININPRAYKYPYWNKGKWNFNYIRNDISINKSSDKSAIFYGKYFVARFIFDNKTKYKFENIDFITNNE